MKGSHSISLRAEHDGDDHRYLDAHLDSNGDLHISGQDLGPGTALVGNDGEYEWEKVIAKEDIPALLTLLNASVDADILEELAARYTGRGSYELERRLRESDIPVRFWRWP